MRRWVLLCWLVLMMVAQISVGAVYTEEQRLLHDLFKNYSKYSRPTLRPGETVMVTFRAKLKQIVDLKDNDQLLKVILYNYMEWENPILRWNPKDYGGVTAINVSPQELWVPDIVIYNSAEDTLGGGTHKYKTEVYISANGTNIWLAPAMFLTTCQLDVRYFPFDEQKCLMKFGSWTHDVSRLDMRIQTNASSKDVYTEHGEWELLGIQQDRNHKKYDCCPKPYADISYTIHIRRKSLFYSLYLILPALLITSMVLVGFRLPPESGERMQLGITVLLAMIVFLQFVYQNLPSTSDNAPLLGKFYIVMMFLIALSLVCTCVILNYSYGNHGGEMPVWVRIIILDCLARVFDSKIFSTKSDRLVTGEEVQRRGEEWKRAARILDRFFMVAFSVMITLAIIAIFLQAPSYVYLAH